MWLELSVDLAKALGAFVHGQLKLAPAWRVAYAAHGEPNVYGVDLAAEEFTRTFLAKRGVRALVLSEDSKLYASASERGPAEVSIIVDPLDGSSNAVRGTPLYTISVAIGSITLATEFSFKDVHVGTVYNPVTESLYVAQAGKGATMNGAPLRVGGGQPMASWNVGAIFSLPSNYDLSFFNRFKSFRNFGCATEHLCGVARGGYDAYVAFDKKLRVYDIAAAGLILREAGGILTDCHGDELVASSTENVDFLASASEYGHRSLLELLSSRNVTIAESAE